MEVSHPKTLGPQILQETSVPHPQCCSLLMVRLLLGPIGLKHTGGQFKEQAGHMPGAVQVCFLHLTLSVDRS